jgi:hypothetical protein
LSNSYPGCRILLFSSRGTLLFFACITPIITGIVLCNNYKLLLHIQSSATKYQEPRFGKRLGPARRMPARRHENHACWAGESGSRTLPYGGIGAKKSYRGCFRGGGPAGYIT